MNLVDYINQHTSRKDFARRINVKLSYLHNLCQNPSQAGKKTILKIEKATNGMVTFADMAHKS